MSLTRKEWEELWHATKVIEQVTMSIYCGEREFTRPNFKKISDSVNEIKNLVQQVIGQME